jgi:hypothetical protein
MGGILTIIQPARDNQPPSCDFLPIRHVYLLAQLLG